MKTRQAFREVMTGWILREIGDEFEAAGIECDRDFEPNVGGQRRAFVEKHYRTISWADPRHIAKVIQVFENVLERLERQIALAEPNQRDLSNQAQQELLRTLQKDGYQWVDGRIESIRQIPLISTIKESAVTFDAKHLRDQIRRIEASIESDPSLAIGTAKELIETCCKTILSERGLPVSGSPEISALTKDTLKALKLVPEGISEAARGSDVIKRLLSNLGTIGNGLAELRGLYGTGHGQHGKSGGLRPRHARLAAGAAITLATFLFETHQETLE
jgi:hypothetical protein